MFLKFLLYKHSEKFIQIKSKSFIYTAGAILCWATVATAFKFSLKYLSYAQLLLYSSVTSCIFFFFLALIKNKKELMEAGKLSNNKLYMGLGFFNPFLYYLLLFKAYDLLPAQEAQALNFTWPILLTILMIIFLREKITFYTFAGLLLGFLGVVIIASKGNLLSMNFESPLGVSVSLGSAFIWALFWLLNLKDKTAPTVKLFYTFLWGSLYTLIYTYLFDSITDFNPIGIWGALYVGLFEMGITFLLWIKGLELSKQKAKTSTSAFLIPFISFIFIAFLLKEKIAFSSILGLVVILCGILTQKIDSKK